MERILRSKEMAEIKLLPIRHHSPVCAFHVEKVIQSWKPSVILIEGPDSANALLPVLVHSETKAPFAIYYSYHDTMGQISEEKGHYKCYYPFLDYSPELVALREGSRQEIPVAFIDLPYGEILAASQKGKGLLKEEEKNNYNDDYLFSRNEYIRQLCEKTGLRHFDEFWEKYFELDGLYQESEIWFSNLLTYCQIARENTPKEVLEEEGCVARESYMAASILKWIKNQKNNQSKGKGKSQEKAENKKNEESLFRVLVLTGGFHTPALQKLLEEEVPDSVQIANLVRSASRKGLEEEVSKEREESGKKSLQKDQGVYLMPYSMEATDALNGYSSGMPFPEFYQRIWEGISENVELSYHRAVLDLIVSSGKETRKKEGFLSTYDEICACQMAEGLAGLRGKPEPGAYELLDAVLSSYVKGEYNLATDTPIRILRKQMTGNRMGKLCQDANVPPIIHDFEVQCKKFGLKIQSTLETETTLSIFSSKKHRQISMFFHRMVFLKTAFAQKIKGPNLQVKKDKNLMREIWKYKWNIQVHASLIDVSVHGATIEEAVISLVKEELKKEMGAGKSAMLLTQVFEMGLREQLLLVYDQVYERILKDTDFYSVADALKSFLMMEELGSLYGTELKFNRLLPIGVQKLITLLPSMTRIKDEDLAACMDACKLLYQITGRKGADGEEFLTERSGYFEALEKMVQDTQIQAGLNGCIHGILYGGGREELAAVERICRGYLTGTREQMMKTALFFRGLFYTARDLVFIGGEFLEILDGFFGQVKEAEFMELLPELRMAFTYFTPREIDRIAEMAAQLHGKKREDVLEIAEVLPEWYGYGKEVEAYVCGRMLG